MRTWNPLWNDHLGMFLRCERMEVRWAWCSLHVASVAEIDSRLVSAFVWAILKRNDVLTSFQLFVAEIPDVLLRFLWPDRWLAEVVRLKIKSFNESFEFCLAGFSLFFPTTANRWRQSSSSDAPISLQTGMSLEREHRRPLRLPRRQRCSPCTWMPFCFRWLS